MEFLSQPWPWYVAGPIIAIIMFLLLYFGKSFGVSANLRTMCTMAGAGKVNDFFNIDWKSQIWNIVFIAGGTLGGFIAAQYFTPDQAVHISEATKQSLIDLGIQNPGAEFVPQELFGWEALFSLRGFLMMVVGGFFVGFGTRYAGGCTSGHAISGLSDLQLPSLIAVIGFFVGGLFMTHLVLPWLLQL